MAAQYLKIRTTVASIDPIVDPSGWSHVYFALLGPLSLVGLHALVLHELAFLNTVPATGTHALEYYLANVMDRTPGGIQYEIYDITGHLDGSPAGAPIHVETQQLGSTTSGTDLPEQISGAVGYRGDYGTDVEFGPGTRPRARDRNRTYVGPLNNDTVDHDGATGRCTMSNVFRGDLLLAMHDLALDFSADTVTTQLAVWSRKNASTKPVVEVFADNRFDVQRRRADPNPAGRIRIPVP
jgi:hypothetical protein